MAFLDHVGIPSQNDPIAGLESELAELKAKSNGLAHLIGTMSVTGSDQAGAVSVTVGAGGNLLDIKFGRRAMSMLPTQLTELVLKLVRKAQYDVAQEMRTALDKLPGSGSGTMDLLASFLPVRPENDTRGAGPRA
ncbi:MAG TPA: YbaB/EbfC family nucleoid-associated protein [Amycolatopsis sp.]|jgi:DNA-binding protein YbaB|nr:YbaB/EbfC family nucleoid-associated protein [Amycolatopsis sp.]